MSASTTVKVEQKRQGKGKQTKKQKAAGEKTKRAGKTAAFISHGRPPCFIVCNGGSTTGGSVSPRSTRKLGLSLRKKHWSEILTQVNVVV